jgi:hypothetical protein
LVLNVRYDVCVFISSMLKPIPAWRLRMERV